MKSVSSRKKVPTVRTSTPKKTARVFKDYTLFATYGRVERPVGTSADFADMEAMKSSVVHNCLQSGAEKPAFRVVERDYDDSRDSDEILIESEVK